VSTPDELTSAATTSTGVRTYDVVVIGAGPVGENVADYARKGGLSVVVVERELVGGECSYWACIPSKALLRPVHAVAAAQRVAGAAQAVTGPLDAAAVLARRDAFVHGFDDAGQVGWLEGAGIALVRGVGRLAGERRVVVDTATGAVQLAARRAVVVCTGSAAVLPPVPGLEQAQPWTSREVTAMPHVPRRLAVIGGGVVSLEMAAAAKGLGAEEVTVLVRGDRVLEQVEAFAGELVVEGLREAGVDVRFRTTAQRVERTGDGPVRLHLDDVSTLEADELLVATGRRPRTDDLGLETVGLEPGRSLPTDDGQAVHGVDGGWLFAAGDVTGRVLLTHQGKYQARLLGDRLAARRAVRRRTWPAGGGTRRPRTTPRAAGGLHRPGGGGRRADRAAGGRARAAHPAGDLRPRFGGRRLAGRGRLPRPGGAARRPGPGGRAGRDLRRAGRRRALHSATIAIVGEVPLSRLWHAVPAFPTISEVWLRLLEELRTSA
jgi:dihydrolipoamide dehydrogenase